jgi:hypothetical protein
MTKKQFLLLKLIEECVEVAHIASKQLQFGKDKVQKNQLESNTHRLKGEILDLNALVHLLQEESEIPVWSHEEFLGATNKKKVKLQKYLDLSTSLGQLPEIKL